MQPPEKHPSSFAAPAAASSSDGGGPAVVKRRRVRRKKAGCQEQAHCGGLTNSGLLGWWDDAVSGVWDTAAGVLGVAQGTLSQEDAEARMASLPGGPQPSAVRRRTSARSLTPSASPADAAAVAPTRTPSPLRRRGSSTLDPQTGKEVGGGKGGLEGDGDIPGLDFLYRIYAPRELIQRYEALEKEVASPDFKLYSAQDQAEALEDLAVTQAAIEARENRLNGAMALIGCIHGCYVGLMASLLVVFVPQTCPPSASYATEHTCTLYENTHHLSHYDAAALALNLFTLFLVLLTETLVFRREQFLDKVLSYNPRKPANNLSAEPPDGSPSVLEQHPYVAHLLLWQNLTAGNLARTTCAMVLVNLLVSSVLILGYHNNGSSSIVSLVTNTMLLGSKLLFSAVVCLRSSSNKNGTSLYKVVRVSFNVLDQNFLQSEQYKSHKDSYSWSDVQEEYAKMARAEDGDVKVMASQAKSVLRRVVGRHQTKKIVVRQTMRLGRVTRQGSEFLRAVEESRREAASEVAAAPVPPLQEVPLPQSSPSGARHLWSRDKADAPDSPV